MDPAELAVRARIVNCTSCGLHTIAKRPVPFSGDIYSGYAIIGEAPGKDEDREGKPFVGVSGKVLRRVLDDIGGVGTADIFSYLNVVCCWPGRTPHSSEVGECHSNLEAQLALIHPSFALVVGGVAMSAFWPKMRMNDMRGKWWKHNETWMLSTWHPSAVLRSGGLGGRLGKEFVADVNAFITYATLTRYRTEYPVNARECVKCGDVLNLVNNKGVFACQKHQASIGFADAITAGKRRRTKAKKESSSAGGQPNLFGSLTESGTSKS